MIAKLRSSVLIALLGLFGIAIFARPTEAVSEGVEHLSMKKGAASS